MVFFRPGGELDMGFFVRMLPQVLIGGLVVGAFSYGLAIPYMILALRSGLYRERFYGCLRLREMTKKSPPDESGG